MLFKASLIRFVNSDLSSTLIYTAKQCAHFCPNQYRENHSTNAATSLRIEQPVPTHRTLTDILKSGVTIVFELNGSSRADNSHEHRQQQFHPNDDAVDGGLELPVPPQPHQATVIHDVNYVL